MMFIGPETLVTQLVYESSAVPECNSDDDDHQPALVFGSGVVVVFGLGVAVKEPQVLGTGVLLKLFRSCWCWGVFITAG
jgi:hypothetical protein